LNFSFSSDTLKQSYQEKLLKDLKKDKFSGPRTSRWYYSWVVFRDYTLIRKVFGGGFDYIEKFDTEFNEGETDYPHNPFISAFLYSGIIGGLTYIWFMFMVFYYYIKYYKYHVFYFVSFLITFYFSFFSANIHFSIPIFAIFSIIPFLTRYIVEKEKKEQELIDKGKNPIS
jgi:hypothetical protein